jgi:hypothetical protein
LTKVRHPSIIGLIRDPWEASMFVLMADRTEPDWSGTVGTETFENIEQAEQQMRRWARFGVDNHCSDPDRIWIADEDGTVLKIWDWRTRAPAEFANHGLTTREQT